MGQILDDKSARDVAPTTFIGFNVVLIFACDLKKDQVRMACRLAGCVHHDMTFLHVDFVLTMHLARKLISVN